MTIELVVKGNHQGQNAWIIPTMPAPISLQLFIKPNFQ